MVHTRLDTILYPPSSKPHCGLMIVIHQADLTAANHLSWSCDRPRLYMAPLSSPLFLRVRSPASVRHPNLPSALSEAKATSNQPSPLSLAHSHPPSLPNWCRSRCRRNGPNWLNDPVHSTRVQEHLTPSSLVSGNTTGAQSDTLWTFGVRMQSEGRDRLNPMQ